MGLFSFLKKKPVEVVPPPTYTCKDCGETGPLSYISYHSCEKEIEMNFTFTTREEYVAYREDWKARYAAQILEIRAAKKTFKEANSEFSIASKGERVWDCKTQGIRDLYNKMESARYAFLNAKREATELLSERRASKVEAGRQRELRLKKVA